MALIGSSYTPYVSPTQEELDADTAAGVRDDRDNTLTAVVDPMVSNPLRWSDLTSAKQDEWAQYRTDLLNVPQQDSFPTVIWPTKPE